MSELTDEARRLLSGGHPAHVATLLPDGAPHSVPMWVGLDGDRVTILTSENTRKARNLENDPRVAISVTDRANELTSVLVSGRMVEKIEGDPAWEIIDRMSDAYIGMPYAPRVDRVVYAIEPEQVRVVVIG
ncbi:TIGR03618 family F420-dependent PPOX class oxidoreductase [Jiangella alkaliphila]|uniref:PPOX class probable F420-dependent enzyme n=1 Tax=Jiangella alkaliphila TaxID=419479 RepID=A0A1H2KQ88_9ACTN|nr:TIGR03618 family F420-dependent PPOX class oxidoreductase [Jiangella alkaliphila]SDU70857.1 PPOX class probable F420-dependent enzyme [Jiangella alkaliphila]